MNSIEAKVPRSFAEDFELVANHYKLKETLEYLEAKALARLHLADAKESYAAMRREIEEK